MEAYKNAQELVIEELEKKHVAYTKALGKKLSAKEKALRKLQENTPSSVVTSTQTIHVELLNKSVETQHILSEKNTFVGDKITGEVVKEKPDVEVEIGVESSQDRSVTSSAVNGNNVHAYVGTVQVDEGRS